MSRLLALAALVRSASRPRLQRWRKLAGTRRATTRVINAVSRQALRIRAAATRFEFTDESDYRRGDSGYRSQYGNRDRYRDSFRYGYQEGYRNGYGNYGGRYGNGRTAVSRRGPTVPAMAERPVSERSV